jgi:hypothetical protein
MSIKNRLIATGCILVSAAALAFSQTGRAHARNAANPVIVSIDQSSPGTSNGVFVTNSFPLGVSVGNFPATQQVSGTVSVGNLPTTQAVSGTVDVGNLAGLTHMRALASNHVTLTGNSGNSALQSVDIEFEQIFPDGTRGSTYQVPAGFDLVITDCFWEIPYGTTAGADVGMELDYTTVVNGLTTNGGLFTVTSPAGSRGGIGSRHFTAGVVLKGGVYPTATRIGGSLTNTRFTLLGYLAKDQ